LIFLKYVSDAFEEKHAQLAKATGADPEDRDEYLAENIFWVPSEARWSYLRGRAKDPLIGKLIDSAMVAIERDNPSLKGVLPKDYARPHLDKQRLGELIDLIGNIGLGDKESRSKDILGRVYEYSLSQFASAEGKKGGQFYTPRPVVRLLVEMLAPYKGRVFDPCCGSGGMFVLSERFVEAHGGRVGDVSIFGQESNPTTWRLAKMNLAIRGIDGNLGVEPADSFHRDLHQDLKADYVLANPPFNGCRGFSCQRRYAFLASARISGGNEWYLRQNLLVAEDFIERLYSSGVDVFHRFLPEMIESSRLRIRLNLAIPGIVKIDLGQTLEKLGLVSLGQLLHRFDDFTHGAHTSNLTETFSEDQPSPAATVWQASLREIELLRKPSPATRRSPRRVNSEQALGRLSRRCGRQPPSLVTASHGSQPAISFQARRRFLRCRRTISSRQRFRLFSQNHQLTAA
jgi:predicted RNA methylase